MGSCVFARAPMKLAKQGPALLIRPPPLPGHRATHMPNYSSDRRRFFKQTAAAGALALMGSGARAARTGEGFKAAGFEMGLQLYTIRDPMAKAPRATLEKVAALGYRNLEIFGFDAANLGYYGWHAREFKRVLDELGLRTTTGHYGLSGHLETPLPELRQYVERCAEGALVLGQKYVTWPWLPPQQRTLRHFELLAERLNLIGEQLAPSGLKVAYHNHDFDFIPQDGKLGYDIVMQKTEPALVKLQLDLFWSEHSSQRSAHELFSLQPGRFVMWHIKDMDAKNRQYTEMGNGVIDFRKFLPDMKLAGLEEYFVEQGDYFAVDPMTSIATSAAWVKKVLE
jgi:sugar phosphate isomerase/epimerase